VPQVQPTGTQRTSLLPSPAVSLAHSTIPPTQSSSLLDEHQLPMRPAAHAPSCPCASSADPPFLLLPSSLRTLPRPQLTGDSRDRRDESHDNTKLMLPDAILREHRYGRVLSPCARDSSTDASDDRQSGGQTDDSGSKDDGAAGMGGGLGLCIPGLVNRRSGDAANGEMRTPMAFLQWAPAELPPDDCKESTPKIKWKDPLIEVHEYPAEYDCYDRHDSLEKELFEQALRLDMIDGMPPTNSPRRISPRSYAEKDKEGYALRRNSSSSLSTTTPAKLPRDSTNTQEEGGQQADHGDADEADATRRTRTHRRTRPTAAKSSPSSPAPATPSSFPPRSDASASAPHGPSTPSRRHSKRVSGRAAAGATVCDGVWCVCRGRDVTHRPAVGAS